MRTFLIYFSKLVFISFFIAEALAAILMHQFKSSSFYKTNLPYKWHGRDFDFVILGSSRGLTSINTATLSSGLKKNGFNFSVDDTHLGSQVVMLKHLLNYQVEFDTLFVICDAVADYEEMGRNDYRLFPFSRNKYISNYFKNHKNPIDFNVATYLPFTALGYYNIELFVPSIYTLFDKEIKYNYNEVGDFSYPSDQRASHLKPSNANIDLGVPEVEEIVTICEQNSITPIFIIAPANNIRFQRVDRKTIKLNVIDLSECLPDSKYFFDRWHLNSRGKQKLTEHLLNVLKN